MLKAINNQPKQEITKEKNNPFTGSPIPNREITAINFTDNGPCGSTDVVPFKEHTIKPINARLLEA